MWKQRATPAGLRQFANDAYIGSDGLGGVSRCVCLSVCRLVSDSVTLGVQSVTLLAPLVLLQVVIIFLFSDARRRGNLPAKVYAA